MIENESKFPNTFYDYYNRWVVEAVACNLSSMHSCIMTNLNLSCSCMWLVWRGAKNIK